VAHIVGKSVELNWVKFVVITGGIVNHLFKVLDIILGKFIGFSGGSWVRFEVVSNGGSEFFSVDLSIVVGVDHLEDSIGLFHCDTLVSGDFDGGGGSDEGDKGEFHFDLFVFCFVIII
jgi:hypothetical protein